MKKNLILLLLFLTSSLAFSQTKQEQQLAEIIPTIANLITKADSAALKSYIDPSTGLYVLYSIGVNAEYFHLKALSFSEQAFPPLQPFGTLNNAPIKYEPLPSYNCDSAKWSKQGCFVDTTKKDNTLFELLNNIEATGQLKVPTHTFNVFETIKKNGRRVIVTSPEGDGLIMHLLYKNKQWYLVVVDLLVTNCGV